MAIQAAPPRPDMDQRVSQADVILVAQVDRVQVKDFNEISRTLHLELKTLERVKGTALARINLAFLIFPETFEKHLREPVPEGKYIVFLNYKQSGSDGASILVPATPRQFAFEDFDAATLETIKALVNP